MPGLLEIHEARRTFTMPEGRSLAALDGVTLAVEASEFVTLLGPSGCGKTTLLRTISGFEQLDGGAIRLDGEDLTRLPPFRRPVNTVFQSYALFSHMTVGRNVGYALEVRGVDRATRAREVGLALEKVGLAGLDARKPGQLSGGQRQRVALARAIIAKPRLLLLDEPLSALDRGLRQQMQIELKELQHALGIAFLFVTHDQEEALTMSDRVVVMRAGRIEQIGTPRDIYRRPQSRFVAEFIGETNLLRVTVDRIDGELALARTAEGLELRLPGTGLRPGQKVTAALRPTELMLGGAGMRGTVLRAVYRGADVELRVVPVEGGPELGVITRDGPAAPAEGAPVTLGYDPNAIHVLGDA